MVQCGADECRHDHTAGVRLRRRPVGIYEAVHGLELYAGPGVELEKHENFFVIKLGLEYAFAIANDWKTGVAFGPGFTKEFNTWALGISVARRF